MGIINMLFLSKLVCEKVGKNLIFNFIGPHQYIYTNSPENLYNWHYIKIFISGPHIPDHFMFRLYGATHMSTLETQICNFINCKKETYIIDYMAFHILCRN